MSNKPEHESADALNLRKRISRNFLRSLSPVEKVERLVLLQEQFYPTLAIREQNGGKPIPEKWRKWRIARPEDI